MPEQLSLFALNTADAPVVTPQGRRQAQRARRSSAPPTPQQPAQQAALAADAEIVALITKVAAIEARITPDMIAPESAFYALARIGARADALGAIALGTHIDTLTRMLPTPIPALRTDMQWRYWQHRAQMIGCHLSPDGRALTLADGRVILAGTYDGADLAAAIIEQEAAA